MEIMIGSITVCSSFFFCTLGSCIISLSLSISVTSATNTTEHTYQYDVPALVRSIARSVGDSVYTVMSAPGGYDFERHYKLAETITALQSRKWDYIVLQESGWKTAYYRTQAEINIYPFADSLKNLIHKNNATAKLVLYMTGSYTKGVNTLGDTAWCRSDPQVCTYEGMLDRIKTNYLHLSEQLHAEIAPCGVLWKVLQSKNSSLVLHEADGIHASLAGSYTNALTQYSVISRKPLKNVFAPVGITSGQAAFIQHTISETLFHCNPSWKDL